MPLDKALEIWPIRRVLDCSFLVILIESLAHFPSQVHDALDPAVVYEPKLEEKRQIYESMLSVYTLSLCSQSILLV